MVVRMLRILRFVRALRVVKQLGDPKGTSEGARGLFCRV